MSARLHRGFTLIELMVAMTISVILLLLAMPAYTVWIADGEIRNGAETVASGLRFAQSSAITHNMNAQFVLNANGWDVMMVDTPLVSIQTGSFNEGSRRATFAASPAGATTVAFNPLGQVIANAANLTQVNVTNTSVTGTRPLRVMVGNGRTGVKLCDPAFTWPDPKGCPP
jgi:prepilin-type N-terminal cleavage/methylation domain-containing protein